MTNYPDSRVPRVLHLEIPQEMFLPKRHKVGIPNSQNSAGLSQFIEAAVGRQQELPDFVLLTGENISLSRDQIVQLEHALVLSEKHGFTISRHETLGIGTFPTQNKHEESGDTSVSSEYIHNEIFHLLPEITLAPYANGPVVMAKTHVLLNTIDGLTANERNAFGIKELSIKANLLGYSTVLANKVFTAAPGTTSVVTLGEIDDSFPQEWDGYVAHLEKYFLNTSISPLDLFSRSLISAGKTPRVLIDLTSVEPAINGTSRNALSFLSELQTPNPLSDTGCEITVLISREVQQTFNVLPSKRLLIVNTDEEIVGTYDVGVFLSPITSLQRTIHMNRHCLRWLVCHLDIIALRVLPLLTQDTSRAQLVYDTIRFCDEAIFISEASRNDFKEFFPDSLGFLDSKSVVIHEGTPAHSQVFTESETSIKFTQIIEDFGPDYVLVLGNEYPHKLVRQAATKIGSNGFSVIALGIKSRESDNFLAIPSGVLSDAQITKLITNSLVSVFPSSYEGYGIPIAEIAACGKPIVLFDSEVSREVVSSLEYSEYALFFTNLNELPLLVSSAIKRPVTKPASVRTLSSFNLEIIQVIKSLLERPVTLQNLNNRWAYFTALDNYTLTYREEIRKSSEVPKAPSLKKKILNRLFR